MREWLFTFVLGCCVLNQFFLNRHLESVEYEKVNYESIAVQELKLCKEVIDGIHSRMVYFDPKQQVFIKLWSAHYPLAAHFERALYHHFYDTLAPLKAIIYDFKGVCRGYVTDPCRMIADVELIKRPLFEMNQYGFKRLKSLALQPSIFKNFYDEFLTIINETGMVYLDFVPGNIAMKQNQYVLLDLECVYLPDELVLFKQNRPSYFEFILESLPIEYSQMIRDLLEAASFINIINRPYIQKES